MLNVGSTAELSKSNAYSRSTFTAKINALTAENAKLKNEPSGKKSSGSTASEKPKYIRMYGIDSHVLKTKRGLLQSKTANVIIMAQQQHAADVHPDELCPLNKRYDLMDANLKVDLEHVQCPPSLICFVIINSNYNSQHTLKEDISKYRLRFMLDKKELTLTLDDFRQIFHLPQATANNHNAFVPPPSFSDMVPFYKQVLGFIMELKTQSNFKTTGLLQPWQTLCKIFSKCLTTCVTGWDQPPLQIMQMLYCFVNNIHVDYAELL
ncbi:hypothetical protein Tco_0964177 [Tanacetum coccineum]